ncbi:unnamed protein product [Protopolystoma xenopodis]|uniref:Uncharacterized protein n=1 Tax=Protopolystoma xenopodis TaxID=117903 RepID=A0A448XC08_9PLAT|nr:unnamed protein product [Protopolystoma xenopodis]
MYIALNKLATNSTSAYREISNFRYLMAYPAIFDSASRRFGCCIRPVRPHSFIKCVSTSTSIKFLGPAAHRSLFFGRPKFSFPSFLPSIRHGSDPVTLKFPFALSPQLSKFGLFTRSSSQSAGRGNPYRFGDTPAVIFMGLLTLGFISGVYVLRDYASQAENGPQDVMPIMDRIKTKAMETKNILVDAFTTEPYYYPKPSKQAAAVAESPSSALSTLADETRPYSSSESVSAASSTIFNISEPVAASPINNTNVVSDSINTNAAPHNISIDSLNHIALQKSNNKADEIDRPADIIMLSSGSLVNSSDDSTEQVKPSENTANSQPWVADQDNGFYEENLPPSTNYLREGEPSFPHYIPYLIVGSGTAGMAAARAIRASDPASKVLMIGGGMDPKIVGGVFKASPESLTKPSGTESLGMIELL